MKTENLKYEILSTTNLVSTTDKIVMETATDIFSLTFYKKGWFGWKKKYSFWGFSSTAEKLYKSLKDWLE